MYREAEAAAAPLEIKLKVGSRPVPTNY